METLLINLSIWGLVIFNTVCAIGVCATLYRVEKRGLTFFVLDILQNNKRYFLKINQLWYCNNKISLVIGLMPSNSITLFSMNLTLSLLVDAGWICMAHFLTIALGFLVNYEALKSYRIFKTRYGPDGFNMACIGKMHV